MKQKPMTAKQQAEEMREKVMLDELRARYWRAQYEVKYYTLENEKLVEPYTKWLEDEQKRLEELEAKQEEMQKNFEGALADLAAKGGKVEIDGQRIGEPAATEAAQEPMTQAAEPTEFKERVTETIKEAKSE